MYPSTVLQVSIYTIIFLCGFYICTSNFCEYSLNHLKFKPIDQSNLSRLHRKPKEV